MYRKLAADTTANWRVPRLVRKPKNAQLLGIDFSIQRSCLVSECEPFSKQKHGMASRWDGTVELCRRCGAGLAVVRHLEPQSSVPRKFGRLTFVFVQHHDFYIYRRR